MGLFDDVTYSAPCPKCGHVNKEWQTKSTDVPFLNRVTPEEIGRGTFYAICRGCQVRIEYAVDPATISSIRCGQRWKHITIDQEENSE